MKTTFQAASLALIAVALLAAFVNSGGCSRPEEARRVLSAAGYKDIRITGWCPFMAGEDDTFSTGFRAIGPGGNLVTGAVTSGLLKGNTIRLD